MNDRTDIIYFDNSATTEPSPGVIEAMTPI